MKKHETEYIEMTIADFIPKGCEKAVKEDGKFYFRLVKDYNIMCEVEQETGLNLLTPTVNDTRLTRAMLFAYLKPYNPDVTLSECGDLMTMDSDACFEAMGRVLNMSEGVEAAPQQAPTEVPAADLA
jgi:hypothetical protein